MSSLLGDPIALPKAFSKFDSIGGCLHFAAFECAEDDIPTAAQAIVRLISRFDKISLDGLLASGCREIEEPRFFGDWYDLSNGRLRLMGGVNTADGQRLENPYLLDLEGVETAGSAHGVPGTFEGGNFAYAFYSTPYPLTASPTAIQAIFDGVRRFILPPRHTAIIRDWTSEALPDISRYFQAGAEWWGVFLFTIYVPDLKQLTVIAGSTTD